MGLGVKRNEIIDKVIHSIVGVEYKNCPAVKLKAY